MGFVSFSQDHKAGDDKNAETRDVKGFHAVEVSGGIDLYLNPGDETVAVSASDPAIRDHMRTEVVGGVLKIYLENTHGQWNTGGRSMKAYVSFKQLDAIGASGGSDVYIDNVLKGDRLAVTLSGGGNLKGQVDLSDLAVRQSGGSNVKVTGTVGSLNVETSGGGDFSGYNLVADIGHVGASGGGNIHVTVNKELSVVASGGSSIYYKGTCAVKAVSTSGGSGVYKKG